MELEKKYVFQQTLPVYSLLSGVQSYRHSYHLFFSAVISYEKLLLAFD